MASHESFSDSKHSGVRGRPATTFHCPGSPAVYFRLNDRHLDIAGHRNVLQRPLRGVNRVDRQGREASAFQLNFETSRLEEIALKPVITLNGTSFYGKLHGTWPDKLYCDPFPGRLA